jgi:hypothetical protein
LTADSGLATPDFPARYSGAGFNGIDRRNGSMQRRDLFLLLLFAVPGHADSRKKLSRERCAAINKRIKRLESRLRQGHSAKQGRSLKRQTRELQLKRFRGCR